MKTVCFGEIMLRLNPPQYERFLQTDEFRLSFTGAEANVAVALNNLGVEAEFVTKVPAHEIGQWSIDYVKKYGVSVKNVVRGGERLGLFYLEKGASQRGGKVVYDRANSAIALAKHEEFDWDKIFQGATWFHLTGITPALSDTLAEICLDALKKAKKLGITVSMDLNYREKLWTREKARETLKTLLPYVDYCKDLFWFEDGATEGDIPATVQRMQKEFGIKGVAVTFRESASANEHRFSGAFFVGGKVYRSKQYDMHVVDRVGGGDAFSGGWIYALLNGYEPQQAIEFAVATSCLKHSVEADFCLLTVEEVQNLMRGNGSGRVQR